MAPESSTPSTPASSGQSVQVTRPASGEAVSIASPAGGNLTFAFDPSTATTSRSGNNLVMEVDGGGTVTVTDFFVVGDSSLPTITLPDGAVVAATDFFSGSNLDMTTAAGPGTGTGPTGGGTNYDDASGDLLGGVDRLGRLGTDYWARSTEVSERLIGMDGPAPAISITPIFPGGPGTPDTPTTPDNPVRYIDGQGYNLKVDESYMANEYNRGTNYNPDKPMPAYEMAFLIETNDGLATVTIDGVAYPVAGDTLAGFPGGGLAGANGTLSNPVVTLNPDGTYTLSFTYQQGDAVQHAEGGEKNLADNVDSWDISVTSNNGATAGLTANVDIVDDVPVVTVTEGMEHYLTALVDESILSDAYDDGIGVATISAGMVQAQFDVQYGYDGARSDVFDLKLNEADGPVASGLYAVKDGGGQGGEIMLTQVGDVIYGGDVDNPYFTIEVDPATGEITLTLLRNIWHSDTNNDHNHVETLVLEEGVLTLTRTVVDNDGDNASATIDLGAAGAFNFRDDGPIINMDELDTSGLTLLTKDAETLDGGVSTSDPATAKFGELFEKALDIRYGADGKGSLEYEYKLSVTNTASGLSSGKQSITLSMDGDDVVGKTADGTEIFRISVDDAGTVTMTQSGPIDHPTNNPSEILALGAGKIGLEATVTVTDGDGDSAGKTVEIDLGGNIQFQDHGPSGGGHTAIVYETDIVGQDGKVSQYIRPGTDNDHKRDDSKGTENDPHPSDAGSDAQQIATGSLGLNYGADGKGSFEWTGVDAPDNLMAMVNGEWRPVTWNISGDTITGQVTYTVGTGQSAVTYTVDVMKVTCTDTDTGAYKVELLAGLKHDVPGDDPGDSTQGWDRNQDINSPDPSDFQFNYKITDGDGDSATGSLNVRVQDDIPEVPNTDTSTDATQDMVYNPEVVIYPSITLDLTRDQSSNPRGVEISAKGLDGQDAKVIYHNGTGGQAQQGAGVQTRGQGNEAGSGFKNEIDYREYKDPVTGEFYGVSEQLIFELPDGQVATSLSFSVDHFFRNPSGGESVEIGKVSFYLNGEKVGEYIFESQNQQDTASTVDYKIPSGAFDKVVFEAVDNKPNSWDVNKDNSDYALKTITFNGIGEAVTMIGSAKGTIEADFGADGPASIIVDGFNTQAGYELTGVTSGTVGGEAVVWKIVYDEAKGMWVATGRTPGGELVGILEFGQTAANNLSNPNPEAGWSFTQFKPFDDANDDIAFTYKAVDNDGDGVTGSHKFDGISDKDIPVIVPPVANDDVNVIAQDDAAAKGNVFVNDQDNKDAAEGSFGDAPGEHLTNISHVDTYDDGKNTNADKAVSETSGMTIKGDYGTLTIDAQGNYSYKYDDPKDNEAVRDLFASNDRSASLQDSFTYTITNPDGSTDTATLTIDIVDSVFQVGTPGADGVKEGDNLLDFSGTMGLHVIVSDPGGASETDPTEVVTPKSLNAAIIIDTSGSMNTGNGVGNMEKAKDGLLTLLGQMQEHADKGAVVNVDLISFAQGAKSTTYTLTGDDSAPTSTCYTYKGLVMTHPDAGNVTTLFNAAGGLVSSTTMTNGATMYRILADGTLQEGTVTASGDGRNVTYSVNNWKTVTDDKYDTFQLPKTLVDAVEAFTASGGTNYEAAFNSATGWFTSDAIKNNGYENVSFFITDGKPTYAYRDSFSYNNVTYKVPLDYVVGKEVYYAANGTQLTGATGASYRISADGTFEYLRSANNWDTRISGDNGKVLIGTGSSTTSTMTDQSEAAFKAMIEAAAQNGKVLQVNAIGIGTGIPQSDMDKYDNTADPDTGLLAQLIANAGGLGDVLKAAFDKISTPGSLDASEVGGDVIIGGDGGNLIFGDAMNADFMLDPIWQAANGRNEAGNTWVPNEDLVNGGSMAIIEDYLSHMRGSDYSKDDIREFVMNNHEELGKSDTVLAADDMPRGADDLIIGGSGDDIIFGQGGDDTIIGGGGDDLIFGGKGSDILYGGDGADTFAWLSTDYDNGAKDQIMDFNQSEGDMLRFDDLLGQGGLEQLDTILGTINSPIKATVGLDHLDLTLTHGDVTQTVEITMDGGIQLEKSQYSNYGDFAQAYNNAEADVQNAMMAELLKSIIAG